MHPLRHLRLLALFLLTAGLQAAEPLKVVAWNIEWFPGLRPTASAAEADAHMAASKEELRKINPDIFIGLEMRDWDSFNELVSAVPGLTTHVVSSFVDPTTGQIRNQQIGIASKLTCRAAAWDAWQANVPNISRGFSFAALEQKDGGLLMIYGNHLRSNLGKAEDAALIRNDQAKQLIAHRAVVEAAFQGKRIAGWISAGDFNTNHDNQFPLCTVVQQMTDAGFRNTWADTPREERLTWRSQPDGRFEPTTFDYFFTLGLGDLKASIIDTPRSISDHHVISILLPQE